MLLRLNRFLPATNVEGPGKRACLWVQGCPIRCPDCANKETWDPCGGYEVPVCDLIRTITGIADIEGVTFLGGEPFYQAAALAELGAALQQAGLSVITFTGYVYEDIRKADREDWNSLLEITDVLIDGPYNQELFDLKRPWVGSSNQRYHFLTDQYVHLKDNLADFENKFEIRVSTDGTLLINGMGDYQKVKSMFTL